MHHFPKKMCLIVTAVVAVMLSICALAYENEPSDFRGVKWGTHIEKLSDMVLALDGGDFKAYTRKGDKMVIGDATLNSLHYIFYKDEFYCVRIEFAGFSSFSKIRDEVFRMHGEPAAERYFDRHFYWGGSNTSIKLDYDDSTETGELGYKFLPIDFQIDEDERMKATGGAGEAAERSMSTSQ